MNLYSWGQFPKLAHRAFTFINPNHLKQQVSQLSSMIARGNGRSYGDSALNCNIMQVRSHHYFLDFNQKTGLLHIQAGILLAEIIETFVPRGWFLKVTPGTKLITVGGAIASDVHGKNHHISGCFSESLVMFNLMLPSGEIVCCSSQENSDLFYATCGGMGLTGVILDAKIELKKINSQFIQQTTIKTRNLKETFAAFEQYQQQPYSVAWIDCLAKGEQLGRCLLMGGDFSDDGDLVYQTKKKLNIPFTFPNITLNKWTIKAFNWFYYNKGRKAISQQKVGLDSFFYPLDAIANWNRIYGSNGFTQYQFILPKETSFKGLEQILTTIADSGKGSFLAVLKLYGKANANYLSFPMEGYSLALDFKIEKGIFKLLDQLDAIVLQQGGRIYLAKDCHVSKETFEQGYPQIKKFRALRKKYKMNQKFNSLQSQRVDL